ncbi:MAG: outer membrane lipoprotein carrier protein LolA [Bacteroidota bacterium]
MRKFHAIFIIFIFLAPTISSLAQEQKAKDILDKVSEKTKSFSCIQVDFKFTMENAKENIEEKQTGILWIKGNKYKLDLMGTETYFDETTVWTYIINANEVNISEPDENSDDVLNPAKILSMYETGFKYYFKQEKFEANRPLYVIDLIPIDLEKDFSRIRLSIDKSKDLIYEIKRFGKDGNIYTIIIGQYTTTKIFTDSMFKFDASKFPGVEIIDMR